MEIRREDKEVKEREEQIEEEDEKEEEEEKDLSQEEGKESQKVHKNIEQSKNNGSEIITEKEKLTFNSKENNFNEYHKDQDQPINKEKEQKQDDQEQEQDQDQEQEQDLEETSTYILKYTRKNDELKELSIETGLRKSEHCLFMLNIKLIKNEDASNLNQNTVLKETPREPENFLVFCCHEIAAIYFDEIYERIYTLKDLAKENKYFKVFESTKEAKNVIDETIRTNEKNARKIFIAFKDKELKLHMKLSFFDKEKEIVLNIPKKPLTNNDKVNLLPEFLKEIQDKMNHLKEENKKLKVKIFTYNNRNKEIVNNYINNNIIESKEEDKEKKEINSDINNEIRNNDFGDEKITKNNDNNINIDNTTDKYNINNIIKDIKNGNNPSHKKGKKANKGTKKKHLKPEENFF